MKPIKWSNAFLSTLSVVSLSSCANFWGGHQATQSSPYPDQSYWTDRTWREDISRRWGEDDRRLSRMRLGEFIH